MQSAPTERTIAAPSTPDLSTLAWAQQDMRSGYMDGGAGVLVSGLVWAVAGGVAAWVAPERAVLALFVGGMFIHPLAVLLVKLLGGPGRHTDGNPLGPLAMATTFWMIMLLPLAYGVSLLRLELFFPAMMLVIGGRYLCFHTLYGNRLYWVMGAVLGVAGYAMGVANASVALSAFTGAAIEIGCAGLLLARCRRQGAPHSVAA